ncbi:MAG: BREX system ATP-binding domain-containing protein [Trueperaceae bacterium]
MIGERVEHPSYGPGIVLAAYRSGSELLVRFESGMRFRRPRREFVGQSPRAQKPTSSYSAPAPMPRSQLDTRRLIEALRFGVAPAAHLRELTIGLAAERESVIAALNESHETGGAVRAVLGEYGYGKSHLVELSAQEALARGFLVSSVSLDLLELPPHRAFDIYRELLHGLRTPDRDERGLGPLLERSTKLGLSARLRENSQLELDPLLLGLDVLANAPSNRQQAAWRSWLMGGRRTKLMNKVTPKELKFPTIYKVGHNARQIAYLLSGISVLARLAGYSGLCVLVDEAESYSLLRAQQRPKAGLFFAAMIHAAHSGTGTASGERSQPIINEGSLPQHRLRDYPASYGAGQSLFFLFAVTRSENQLPLEEWLSTDEILQLDPHPRAQEVAEFLRQVQEYHAQAYGYGPGERQDQLRRAAAEQLALAAERKRLSIRGLVRLSVELLDLAYLHPDYQVADLQGELQSFVTGTGQAPP